MSADDNTSLIADLHLMVGRIEGKLDNVLDDHERLVKRVTSLERDRNKLAGILGLMGAIITWLGRDHIASLVAFFH